MRRPLSRPGFVVISVLSVWAATAVALAAWWPIHESAGFVVMAIGAVLAATAVTFISVAARLGGALTIAIAASVFAAIGVPLAVPSQALSGVLPTAAGLIELVRGVVFSWKQLLTISLPVGDHQALLVPAFVSTYGCVIVSLSIALRSRRGELATVPPLLLFVAGLALGAESAWHPRALSVAMLVVTLAWLTWRGWYRRRDARRSVGASSTDVAADAPASRERSRPALRTAVGAALTIAVAGGAGAAAVAVAPPATERTVARSVVEQPFDPRDEVSPLAGFRRYLLPEQRDAVLFTVSGFTEGTRLRLAALDEWNGEIFGYGPPGAGGSTGVFAPIPSGVERAVSGGTRLDIDVRIDSYSGFWVPIAGELVSVRFDGDGGDDFVFDPVSGTGAVVDGADAITGYRFTAALRAQPTAQRLPDITPGAMVQPRWAEAPEALLAWLDEATGVIDGAGARLVAAIDRLRSEGYISHGQPGEVPSRAGHSSDRLAQLVTERPMVGDAEQYAAAAAIIAQQLGFPVRVVMGFAPDSVGDGATAVRGADVTAWIEVGTAEYGWVTIDPVPEVRDIPERQPDEPVQVARPQTVLPPPPALEPPGDDTTPPESIQDDPEPTDSWAAVLQAILTVAAWVVVAIIVIAAPFLAVIAAKLRRRQRRRRQRDPLRRIRGAWDEFSDALVDHGVSLPTTATRREVAGIAGGGRARVLASATDRAVFAPAAPGEGEAAAAWFELDRLRESLNADLNRRQRARALLSLRSLGRYSDRRMSRRRPRDRTSTRGSS